jgi:hypothetical protein
MTQAQQVLADFRNATKTVSIVTLARRAGAVVDKQVEFEGTTIFYHFADKSWLATKGAGRNHQAWTNAEPVAVLDV